MHKTSPCQSSGMHDDDRTKNYTVYVYIYIQRKIRSEGCIVGAREKYQADLATCLCTIIQLWIATRLHFENCQTGGSFNGRNLSLIALL